MWSFFSPPLCSQQEGSLDQALDDFSNILQYGYISRVVQKELTHFPCQLSLVNESLLRLVDFTSTGHVKNNTATGGNWHNDYPMQYCLKAIGIKEPAVVLSRTLEEKNKIDPHHCWSVGRWLARAIALCFPKESREAKFEVARGHLEAINRPPLLCAWENGLIAMKINSDTQYINTLGSNMLRTYRYAQSCAQAGSQVDEGVEQAYFNTLGLLLGRHSRFLLQCSINSLEAHQELLLFTEDTDSPGIWKGAYTPASFQAFVEGLSKAAVEQVQKTLALATHISPELLLEKELRMIHEWMISGQGGSRELVSLRQQLSREHQFLLIAHASLKQCLTENQVLLCQQIIQSEVGRI